MLSKIKFLFGLKKGLMVRNAQSLSCYECNSLMSVGCDNPANSGSYFYNFCGNDFQFCVVNSYFNFKFKAYYNDLLLIIKF